MSNKNFEVKNGLSVGDNAIIDANGNFTIPGSVSINTATLSVSTLTGALIVKGGTGIGGDLWVGGNINVAGAINLTGSSNFTDFTATTGTFQTLVVTSSTISISTTTGALTVKGGVGIGDSVYVGNRVGFVGTTGASVVYQFYNTATNSLDTVFG